MRKVLSTIIAVIITLTLCGAIAGHCAIPPGTPSDTLCKAELDSAACSRFQKFLSGKGHVFRVLEGVAFATAGGAREQTFLAVLKCVDPINYFIYIVALRFEKGKLVSVDIKPTGERQLPA